MRIIIDAQYRRYTHSFFQHMICFARSSSSTSARRRARATRVINNTSSWRSITRREHHHHHTIIYAFGGTRSPSRVIDMLYARARSTRITRAAMAPRVLRFLSDMLRVACLPRAKTEVVRLKLARDEHTRYWRDGGVISLAGLMPALYARYICRCVGTRTTCSTPRNGALYLSSYADHTNNISRHHHQQRVDIIIIISPALCAVARTELRDRIRHDITTSIKPE